jgi:hypothetical protein
MKSTPVACTINMLQTSCCKLKHALRSWFTLLALAAGSKIYLFIYYCKILHSKDFYSTGHKIKHFNQFSIWLKKFPKPRTKLPKYNRLLRLLVPRKRQVSKYLFCPIFCFFFSRNKKISLKVDWPDNRRASTKIYLGNVKLF